VGSGGSDLDESNKGKKFRLKEIFSRIHGARSNGSKKTLCAKAS